MDARRVPYAIGGAIAYGIWAVPRATQDVDVTVFVEGADLALAFAALADLGASFDHQAARVSIDERGDFRATVEGMRLDVFTPSIPFYESVKARRRQVVFRERPLWILAAEDLAVFKMLFFRPKDLLDLERMLALMGKSFDRAYVRGWLVDMVGGDDARGEVGRARERSHVAARTAPITAGTATSPRSTRCPSDTGVKPCFSKSSSSKGTQPPSGPIASTTCCAAGTGLSGAFA